MIVSIFLILLVIGMSVALIYLIRQETGPWAKNLWLAVMLLGGATFLLWSVLLIHGLVAPTAGWLAYLFNRAFLWVFFIVTIFAVTWGLRQRERRLNNISSMPASSKSFSAQDPTRYTQEEAGGTKVTLTALKIFFLVMLAYLALKAILFFGFQSIH